VIDQILSDGAMSPGHCRDFQFGADAIDTGDQHGLVEIREGGIEQGAESADAGEDARSVRGFHLVGDAPHEFFARIDVHSGMFVRKTHCKLRKSTKHQGRDMVNQKQDRMSVMRPPGRYCPAYCAATNRH
jgi:hypothetical protein